MTLRTDIIAKADGSKTIATDYVVDGTAKAWGSLTGSGTISLNQSSGVSSITDQGSGKYQWNLTAAMADTGYVPNVSKTGGNETVIFGTVTTTSFRLLSYRVYSGGGSWTDQTTATMAVHGDLA